jgi:sortase (surface protein transpeptidase)
MLGRLHILALDLSVMVLEGAPDRWTLNRAVGHIENTALPGESGNVGESIGLEKPKRCKENETQP